MPRVIWKGAISFGLVHIPVVLHAASTSRGLSFDLVDKRTSDPIGYKKYNKTTGEEVSNDDIVRAFEYAKDSYVFLSDDEIRSANIASTQTVEIVNFVDYADVPFFFLDTPYYLAPDRRGDKVYALLRDALLRTKKIGIARVVLHTKEHLAALVPLGKLLILDTLRWSDEIVEPSGLEFPGTGKAAGVSAAEMAMAEKLIAEMSIAWDPAQYKDRFRDDIEDLVARKVKAGKTTVIEAGEVADARLPATTSADDLTALLKGSLKQLPAGAKEKAARKTTGASATQKSATSRNAAKKATPKKAAPKKAAKKSSKRSRRAA